MSRIGMFKSGKRHDAFLGGVVETDFSRQTTCTHDENAVRNCQHLRHVTRYHQNRKGHERIGFLAGQSNFTTALERADGLRGHGLPVDEARISIGHTDLATAREAATRLLTATEPVTALIGGNNLATIAIMLAAQDCGMRVPADLAVAGFDDFD